MKHYIAYHNERKMGQPLREEIPLALNDLPWFWELLQQTDSFDLGVHQMTDENAIATFLPFAKNEGWQPERC